jgi:signal transduction histidine kinase
MHLESRYNALIKVQGETLNTLSEGVALFGPTGACVSQQRVCEALAPRDADLEGEPHVDKVVRLCAPLSPADGSWPDLTAAVSGFSDRRVRVETRMERPDGSVLECAAEPLPDGGTLLTFVDVTASVNVERALTERNDALELASRLRNEFVHHVSYELRSPLTNIIGFTELLGAETDRKAERAPARIRGAHHAILRCASRHHQRHPGPRLHRRRHDRARPGADRHSGGNRGRRPGHP